MDPAQSHNTLLSVQQLTLLSSIITCLKQHLKWHQDYMAVDIDNTPWALPVPVAKFCADALAVPLDIIEYEWETLRDTLWKSEGNEASDETSPLIRDGHLLNTFLTHGINYKLGALYNGYTYFASLMY